MAARTTRLETRIPITKAYRPKARAPRKKLAKDMTMPKPMVDETTPGAVALMAPLAEAVADADALALAADELAAAVVLPAAAGVVVAAAGVEAAGEEAAAPLI